MVITSQQLQCLTGRNKEALVVAKEFKTFWGRKKARLMILEKIIVLVYKTKINQLKRKVRFKLGVKDMIV